LIKKLVVAAVLLVIAAVAVWALMPTGDQDLVRHVNPLIGTDSSYELSRGNSYPAVALPHGMIQWTPQSREDSWIYQYDKKKIQGIRGTHSPSVWMGDYGNLTVMPTVGKVVLDPKARASRFSHQHETATPHHYRVRLDDHGVTAEVTPTMRGGRMRLTFPETQKATVLLDILPGPGQFQVVPEKRTVLVLNANGQRGNPPNFAAHFVIVFDRPFSAFGVLKDETVLAGQKLISGKRVGAYVQFATKKGEQVNLQIAHSFINREQAETNLATEVTGQTFDALVQRAKAAWNKELGRVEVEGTPAAKTKLYTALYRALLYPRVMHELTPNGEPIHYSPYDGKKHAGVMYTDTGFWDTYRAQLPLLTLLVPERAGEILQGLVSAYREGGWIPKWPSPGYRSVMIGTHADAFIADAYAKGVRSFDASKAYEGMVKHAMYPGKGPYAGRVGISQYRDLGYVPAAAAEHSASRTLEFAYGDYCVARVATAMGHKEQAKTFAERARNYANVFDAASGFMRGRTQSGAFLEPFDPTSWGGPYVEGAAWHYLWSVQHDVPGLIKLLGGRQAFAAKLDAMFSAGTGFKVGGYKRVIHEMREQQLAKMGQYAHPNEPVHHVLYLYNYAGQPYKTQRRVREVQARLYGTGPDGLLGDEDNGQMSAWYVFSAMGFYPVCPGQPIYAIGSPELDEATIHLPGGKTFVVRAPGNSAANRYVQKATLNGEPLQKTWFDHQTLVAGGELTLHMGPKPNKEWGSRPADAPPGAMSAFAK